MSPETLGTILVFGSVLAGIGILALSIKMILETRQMTQDKANLLKERNKNQLLQAKLGRLRQEHTNLLTKYKAVKQNLKVIARQHSALSRACEPQDRDDFAKELD